MTFLGLKIWRETSIPSPGTWQGGGEQPTVVDQKDVMSVTVAAADYSCSVARSDVPIAVTEHHDRNTA